MRAAPITTDVTVRLLGTFEVAGSAGTTAVAGAKQRAVLARLAVDAGRTVTVDQLVDGVWGETPPSTVRAALQVHVSQIRRSLQQIGLDDVLRTRANGYELAVERDAVDALKFERLASSAVDLVADGDHASVVDAALTALALWFGDPLGGIGPAPFAGPYASRLVDRRLDLLVVAADAAIMTGRASELVLELEMSAADHPYHEPLWAALARTLYAGDRQTDALDRLTTLRQTIRDDLGLEPAAMVDELERRILVHDPALHGSTAAVDRVSAARAIRSHIPTPRPLIGRETIIESLGRLVSEKGQVTLLGPAGVGKTALAVLAANRAANQRPDGATFVDLAAVDDGQEVVNAVASALSLRSPDGRSTASSVCELLVRRDALLVLDNCEHVRHEVAGLLDDLAEAPDLTVLATSRVPVASRCERILPVSPLELDDGVGMFLERASAADTTYIASDDDLDAIRQVVVEVGGLALGIELVVPLLRSMTPSEILALVQGSTVPIAARPPGLARHRSMDDAIASSIDLLSAPARDLFDRVGLLRSGADLATIAALSPELDQQAERDTPDLVRELVDASLLVAERTPAGTWYRMLFPIQLAARRRAAVRPMESNLVLRRYAMCLTDDVRRLSALIEGPHPKLGVVGIGRRSAGIRQVYAQLKAAGDRSAVQELLAALGPLALAASDALPEASEWIASELDDLDGAPVERRLRVELSALWYGGMPPHDYSILAAAAVERAHELGDRSMTVFALAMLVDGEADENSDRAVETARALVDHARLGDPWLFGLAMNFVLNPMLRARRLAEVAELLDEAFELGAERFGIYEPQFLYQAGRFALISGDLEQADVHFEATGAAALRHGTIHGASYGLFGRATLAMARGDLRLAQSLMLAASEFDRIVSPREVWGELALAAIVSVDLHDEATIERCIAGMVRTDRATERCALRIARGCLQLVRGDVSGARKQLLSAMDAIADGAFIQWFGELVDLWGRTTAPSAADVTRVRDDVLARSITPREAMTVLAALPPGGAEPGSDQMP